MSDIRERDVSNSSLGEENDFSEAEQIKNSILDHCIQSLSDSLENLEKINEFNFEKTLTSLKSHLNTVINSTNSINNIVEKGLHRDDFPNERSQVLKTLKSNRAQINSILHPLDLELKLIKIQSSISNSKYEEVFNSVISDINKSKENIKRSEEQIKKISDNASDKVVTKEIKESRDNFEELRAIHSLYQNVWAVVFFSLAIAVAAIVFNFYNSSIIPEGSDQAEYSYIHVSIFIVKKMVLLALFLAFLRVALRKYNTERNLSIIYNHRKQVLRQYKAFEAGIGDDTQAKNEFRLEIAKYIFSDPESGYLDRTSKSGGEINLNPVLNTVQRSIK